MAFLRHEKKKSGTYLRIVESYKDNGKPKHRTLHSLGKLEDYPPQQLEAIAKKLLKLAGIPIEDIVASSFHEESRVNYGYALLIKKLWKLFDLTSLVNKISRNTRVKFDWMHVLQLMIAERLNEPVSKHQSYFNQEEYIGFGTSTINLEHFYRTLDLLSKEQALIKRHLFNQQRNLFSQELDVVFYDVTTLYFDSQKEQEDNLRQKGYSKDGKAHKLQVVLGLLVDKFRNPITYQIYQGNTYEGKTMIDALKTIKKDYKVDNVIVVADSGMIDKNNRTYMEDEEINYIIGDTIKTLPEKIKSVLLDKTRHLQVNNCASIENFSYTTTTYQNRTIFCTYSAKRAAKDKSERDKLIEKAQKWLENPSQYKQKTKKGAGRFIETDIGGTPLKLNIERIKADERYDGFKAISTTTKLSIEDILSKYRDLFEVEHAFRALKSQLEIRPVFHWTNKRIEGHIVMCFIAYTFLNYVKNICQLQYREIVKVLDQMQMSKIKHDNTSERVYMRSKLTDPQMHLAEKLKLVVPKDVVSENVVYQALSQ